MFGRKKLQKEIDSLKKQIDMLWDASHIKVVDTHESIMRWEMFGRANPYFSMPYHKSTELGVADIVCRIMGHLGLELEYKDGKPERKKIPSGACLVKNNHGVREVVE